MDTPIAASVRGTRIALGPKVEGWGSWEWVGADTARALEEAGLSVRVFRAWEEVDEEVAIVVKHVPPISWIKSAASRSRIIYAPIDAYGSSGEIDSDSPRLRLMSAIVVHCERLRKYFIPYAPVTYMDHHVKYSCEPSKRDPGRGDFLWVGVRSNIAPLAEWLNSHGLPRPLVVLTNVEDPGRSHSPDEFGFRRDLDVMIQPWTPARHLMMNRTACAALDVKGCDFRSLHKPAAKAIDFLASGLPLAMNRDSSPAEHLALMGFDVADPSDVAYWTSREYAEDVCRFGAALREILSLRRVARRWRLLIDAALGVNRHSAPLSLHRVHQSVV